MIDPYFPWMDDPDTIPYEQQQLEVPQELTFDLTTPVDPSLPMPPPVEDHSRQLLLGLIEYHNMGLSMMWGRAEPEITKKTIHKEKTPLVSTWSSEPEDRLSLNALSTMMLRAKVNLKIAPIIICGKASGNLMAIDIDNKHWPGIDARYFNSIQSTYPGLWARLRIHKTPSGGYHILYRTEVFVMMEKSNPKLAWKEGEKEAGIEMRTHGGYIMAPPGMGYSVYQKVPIPTLTVAEHEALVALAVILNEKVTVKEVFKPKSYESIYNQNPFQHFNSSPEAERILINNGWTQYKTENDQFIHFTRPGKDTGVSASFIKAKRLYHVFTSSTDLEPETFSPAFLRCKLEFMGDYKKMYPALVKEGFGRHKSEYEAKVVKKLTETGAPPPANLSDEAKECLKVALAQKDTKYPHGIFWEYNPKNDSYDIHRELLRRFCYSLGLRLHLGEPCIIDGQFVRKLKESKKQNGERDVYNLIKGWIREEDDTVLLKISHEFDRFWQGAGEHTVTTLTKLDTSEILKSNPKTCYKFFRNKIVEITKDEISEVGYEERIDKLIWADEVIDRDWNYVGPEVQEKCMYGDFLGKAISGDQHYVRLIIGYLCNGYKTDSESYLVALMEHTDASLGGGTGKGFFAKILRFWCSVLITNGLAVKKDIDQLIQNWNGEKIVHLSDLPKWVDLGDLKHVVSDDSQRKLLYKDIQNIPVEDMPKFVMSGQFGLDTVSDGGVKGRIRQLAFSSYFGRLGNTIRDEYGGDCPQVWDTPKRCKLMGWDEGSSNDWDGYFSYIADSVKIYLGARKIDMVEDYGLWLKGWEMRYSCGETYLREAIEDKMDSWSKLDYVTNKQVWDWYQELCLTNGVEKPARIKSLGRLHKALMEYGDNMKLYEYSYGKDRQYVVSERQRVVKIKMLAPGDGLDVVSDPGDDEEVVPF